jgi:hypothetical protein
LLLMHGLALWDCGASTRACFVCARRPRSYTSSSPKQLRESFILHRRADARAHIPSSLVRAGADHPVNLMGAHALLGVEHEEDNAEPFSQQIVGVLE